MFSKPMVSKCPKMLSSQGRWPSKRGVGFLSPFQGPKYRAGPTPPPPTSHHTHTRGYYPFPIRTRHTGPLARWPIARTRHAGWRGGDRHTESTGGSDTMRTKHHPPPIDRRASMRRTSPLFVVTSVGWCPALLPPRPKEREFPPPPRGC